MFLANIQVWLMLLHVSLYIHREYRTFFQTIFYLQMKKTSTPVMSQIFTLDIKKIIFLFTFRIIVATAFEVDVDK